MPNILIQFRLPLSLYLILFSTILLHDHACGATVPTENPTESLFSLPYLDYVEKEKSPNKAGTTIYKKEKAFPGYNLYASREKSILVDLIDMNGALIHQWELNNKKAHFRGPQVTPLPDGSIFLTSQWTLQGWKKIDANSHTIATYDIPGKKAHHSSYCLKDGGFIGIVGNVLPMLFQDLTLNVRQDSLIHVGPNGQLIKTIPLSKLFAEDPTYQQRMKDAYTLKKAKIARSKQKSVNLLFDPFHTNNIENLEWDIPGIAKKGSWLVTIRHLDKIIIVDPEKEKIVWQWGENIISKPHDATFLKGDQILLFDNGVNKRSSRVIVLDLRSKKIVWQYGQKPGQEFYSPLRGSAQRLPNGNTLIADSNNGRAFEVTLDGEIVWEWFADFYAKGKQKGKRKAVYRIKRLPYDFFKGVTFNHGKQKPE